MASRKSKVKFERYRRGWMRGGIYTVPSGQRCFLAHSKLGYIFCAGEKTISDAEKGGSIKLMGALLRMPPKPHSEMKLNRPPKPKKVRCNKRGRPPKKASAA